MKNNQAFIRAMTKTGDKTVLFSDEILKVNKKFVHICVFTDFYNLSRLKTQKRIIVVTDLAIYTLMADSLKIKRRVAYTVYHLLLQSLQFYTILFSFS